MPTDLLMIPVMSLWNRFRGSGWVPYNKTLAWVLLGNLYWITGDLLFTAIVIVGAFVDFKLSWGWTLDLGRGNGGGWSSPNDPRWDIPYVKAIYKISGGNDHIGMFLRRLFIAPLFVGMWYFGYASVELAVALTFAHAALMVVGYEIGWRLGGDGIGKGEWITGAFFGAILGFLL